MKKLLLIIGLFVLNFTTANYAFAQDEEMTDDELLNGFDYEPIEAESQSNAYKVLGIGYTGNLFFGNVDDFNTEISQYFNMPDIEMPMYMNGFGLLLALEPTMNFSIGFNYSVGNKSINKDMSAETALDGVTLLDGYTRYLDYRQSFTNLELNYAFVPFKGFAALIGANVGLSSLDVDQYQNKSNGDYGEFLVPNDPNTNHRKIEGNFYTVEPKLTLQYKLGANFIVQAAAGYSFAFSPSWTMDNEMELNNVPDKLKPEGMKIQFGISAGIFDF